MDARPDSSRRIGLLAFDGVDALDLTGPLEAFATANALASERGQPPAYRTCVIGVQDRALVTDSALRILPDCDLDTAPALHTLIVPGGAGLREPAVNARVVDWLRGVHATRLGSICTGLYGLAPTGLLDGRRVTTHWRFADDAARRFPALQVDASALYLRDGPYFTAGGVTAGIDLSLALIEEDLGPSMALAVAREMLVFLKRPGDQQQFSEPLRDQMRAPDRFADLVAWIAANLHADLSAEALAARCHLSPRQFARRFNQALGTTPARFVEQQRLDAARAQLSEPSASIERIAQRLGFASADVFRRAFQRRYGVSPASYRSCFGGDRDVPHAGRSARVASTNRVSAAAPHSQIDGA